MCIKLFHFILKIRTKQNIHNKTVIKITEPMMPIIPQINPAFALFPLVPLTFGVTAKQMTAAIPVIIAIGVQQQLTMHTTAMIPRIIVAIAIPLVCSCCGCSM